MSKRHNAIFDDVLKGMSAPETPPADDRGGTRFLKRANALADAGTREEKVLRWVDPETCTMWVRHNRAYDLLSEANCRDLIDSLKAQGQQEFPAIVRRTAGQGGEQEDKHTHPFIQARHVKGPFDHLSNMWVFRALDDHNTQVHFSIRFELDSTLLKNILEPILEKASYSIIDSFESRARTLWGAS